MEIFQFESFRVRCSVRFRRRVAKDQPIVEKLVTEFQNWIRDSWRLCIDRSPCGSRS